MKKSIISILAATVLLSSCSIQQDNYAKRTVSVSGTGSVTVEADTATIILSVITTGKDVAETSAENAKKMTAVQDAVKAKGIQKECISTQNYSVYQESHYDNKSGKQVYDDYRVTNQVKILVKKINMAGEIIDLALKSGANQLSSLTYGVTDTEIAKKQARSLAIAQAQESANLLAGASGAKLGKVLSISEHADYAYPRARLMKTSAVAANDMAIEEAAPTPISGGSSTITISVDAVYQLR
ncbi:MAG: SIMPL domain-containing protein [Treponema sp.]|uniref:SIMPL domain-containing protein n=1 Tax=Treponema sp. TaxID=166 RepID=UPI0025E1A8FB|nr:SIMPL domain-containing protein [Treponema sp.]MBR0496292.1 SIMPL domain-containing protein [Treponema sp.]